MSIECVIVVDYESDEKAETVLRSIAIDNGQFAQVVRSGNEITVRTAAASSLSLLHTLEDLLACMKVAEEMGRQNSGPDAFPDLDG
jgi:hypothetical protein